MSVVPVVRCEGEILVVLQSVSLCVIWFGCTVEGSVVR